MADELLSQDEITALLEGTLNSSSDDGVKSSLSPEQIDSLKVFSEMFKDAVSSVIGMLAGKGITVSVTETGELAQETLAGSLVDGRFLLFSVTCDGFDDAPMAMVMPEKGVMMLADLMMGGEGKDLPDEANELFVNAAQEGLSQVMGSAMTSLSGKLKGRRAIPGNPASKMVSGEWLPFDTLSAQDGIWRSEIEVSIEGLEPFTCFVATPVGPASVFADALLPEKEEEIKAPQPEAGDSGGKKESASQQSPPPASGPVTSGYTAPIQTPATPPVDVRPAEFAPLVSSYGGGGEPSNIDLIADIPVRVTVELGRTRKSVSEILAFAPGSMIELEKMAGEPVDILVNGKQIAKGEVVVIDENFGVRITEILNTDSRMRSVGS